MAVVIQRFGVYLVSLDPTIGHEVQKTRPCLVISPNEMNSTIGTVLVAPMTTSGRAYPTRINCSFKGKKGQIMLDQIRAVDKIRLLSHLGDISSAAQDGVLNVLAEMFAR